MRSAAALLIAVAVGLSPADAEPKSRPKKQKSFLEKLFTPQESTAKKNTHRHLPKQTRTSTRKPKPAQKKTQHTPGQCNCYIVDSEWMAHYRVLEAFWEYPIPEDAMIEFVNGQYHVPAVVYRHYEDMMKTPRPEKINLHEIITDPIALFNQYGFFRHTL